MSHISSSRRLSSGFSLVELLVAVAINLVVVVAAAYLYLGTRESQRTLTERSSMFENGSYALEMLGREIENAGFYPTIGNEGATKANVVPEYGNPVAGTPAAFNAGIFGCNDSLFQPSTSTCVTHTATPVPPADAIVINYFTNDSLSLDVGQRADCQHRAVDADAANAVRAGASTATTGRKPTMPLFISNRYTLVPTTVNIEGQTISTFSLACNGNGVNPQVDTYQPIVTGIEQMRFRYGAMSDQSTLQPSQFLAPADVTALLTIPVGTGSRGAWGRVVAVRACLLVRSMQPARLSRTSYTLTDCNGTSQTYSDGVERKVFTQIFAVKNMLTFTYGI
jgi:type IV pilus assembly protein PilW